MRSIRLILALLLCGAAPAAVAAQETNGSETASLQPGDIIQIQIWREPDLSGDFQVDEDGVAVLPLVGEKRVIELPIRAVRELLMEEYRQYLRNPSITIRPLRRIHVLGEVNRPGVYEVDPTVTLEAAVALAGGATPMGDLNRIRLVRGDTVIRERVAGGEALSTVNVRSGDHILVDRRSWFERNSTFLISVGLSVPSVIAGILALVR